MKFYAKRFLNYYISTNKIVTSSHYETRPIIIVEAITFICKTTICLERLIITTNLSTQREFNLSKVLFDVFKTELLRFCLTKTFPYLKNFLMMLESYDINFLILPSLFHDEIFLTNFHLYLNYSCLPNYF